jgi:aspartate aminotransferase
VIIPCPYWVSYAAMVQLAEGKMVNIITDVQSEFKITPEQLEAAITPKTRLFMFSSPCNPSGSVYSYEELEALAAVFARHPHVTVVSDEIYELIIFEGKHHSIAAFDAIKDQVVVVNGCSKNFAMTGWRIGYIAASKPLAAACQKIQGQFTSGTCVIAQKAAEAALLSDYAPSYAMRDAFLGRRDLFLSLISNIPGFVSHQPNGAFYLFPDVSYWFGKKYGDQVIQSSDDLSLYLLEKAYVATVGGDAFGIPNAMRLSYATSESQLTEAVKRIESALAELTA